MVGPGKPNHSGVYHRHAGETNIIIDYIDNWLLLSYRLTIQTNQFHMHHIPQFESCNVLGW